MEFDKLNHDSLKDQFVRHIQHRIISGDLRPGDRLPPERELAAAMGISRSLVNTGMLELESQGLVRMAPRRGTFVNDYRLDGTFTFLTGLMNYQSDAIDPQLLAGMLEFRNWMEQQAARYAALRATDEELAALRVQYERMRGGDGADVVDASVTFHTLLHAASHNDIMAMLFRSMRPIVGQLTAAHYASSADKDGILALHETLLRALERRDADAAATAASTLLIPGQDILTNSRPTGDKKEK